MIDFYFRDVIIFDKKRINGDGESLFSFSPAPVNRYRKGHQEVLVLDIRKQNKMSLELYKVLRVLSENKVTLTFTQDNNEVFVFEKTSLKADWEFVRGQQNIPLSHKGNHSMRMLAQEFDDIDW